MLKIALLPVWLVIFAVLFFITGFFRLSGMATDGKKGEALLWGTIGIVLGALFLISAAVVVWVELRP